MGRRPLQRPPTHAMKAMCVCVCVCMCLAAAKHNGMVRTDIEVQGRDTCIKQPCMSVWLCADHRRRVRSGVWARCQRVARLCLRALPRPRAGMATPPQDREEERRRRLFDLCEKMLAEAAGFFGGRLQTVSVFRLPAPACSPRPPPARAQLKQKHRSGCRVRPPQRPLRRRRPPRRARGCRRRPCRGARWRRPPHRPLRRRRLPRRPCRGAR